MAEFQSILSFQSRRAQLGFARGLLETVGRSLCPHDEDDLAKTLLCAQVIIADVERSLLTDEAGPEGTMSSVVA